MYLYDLYISTCALRTPTDRPVCWLVKSIEHKVSITGAICDSTDVYVLWFT